jgi:hypothetical protein
MADLTRPKLRVRRVIECRLPIVDSIKTVAARLGAKEEEAWRGIKAKCAAGLLTLEGIDEKGRPRTVERHWIVYIERWGLDLPNGGHVETDMPNCNSGSLIAFDRDRAHRDRRADEADGARPRSLPPRRLRDLVADGAQLDALWSRAEHEFKSPDWSLGNVLSWITFDDPVLICQFKGRRDLLAYCQYDHRRSAFFYPEPRIARADQLLIDALKTECVTAISNGALVPSAYWFGKNSYDLTDDLQFRCAEVTAMDWRQAAERHQGRASEPTDLIPLNAAIERYPENLDAMMRIIEAAWQAGEVILWGRRKSHAMPEPIQQYRGLVIQWHAAEPKGDYYAEAHAHPIQFGAGYYRHEWEDLAIPRADLERLHDSAERQGTLLRDAIAQAITKHKALANTVTETKPTGETDPRLGLAADMPAAKTSVVSGKPRRLRYRAPLAEWMGRKGILLLGRMPPEEIAAGFKTYCEEKRPDLLPVLPLRLRSLEGPIIKILSGMKEAAAARTSKDKDG